MLHIPCPHCGLRAQVEFAYGGDATVQRPGPESTSLEAWLDHVYLRDNPAGMHREWWYHAAGCGKWIALERNTATHRFAASDAAGEAPRLVARDAT